MKPPAERVDAAVEALHAALVQAGESATAARELLTRFQPDTPQLVSLLRRAVPLAFLDTLALTPPWSREARVLASVVMNAHAPARLVLAVLPSLFWRDLAETARTLRMAPPVRARAEALLLERIPDLRLGDRIALGRLATPAVLRELLRDTEARVAEACLTNPRLREEDLLTAVRSGDVPVVLLEEAARSRRWSESYNLRLELVLQMRTPMAVALAQVTSLLPRDLLRVSQTAGLRPILQAAALRALGGKPSGPDPSDGS